VVDFNYGGEILKKIVCLLLLPFVLFLGTQSASAGDSIEGHYFEKPMRELIELGYLKGVNKNGQIDYEPDRSVTRAEFAAFMVRVLEKDDLKVTTPKNFTDVKNTDWFYGVVQQAAQLGVISGKDNGTFAPNEKVTREQIASIMNNALEKEGIILPEKDLATFKDADKVSSYAKLSMQRIVGAGILAGSNNELNPKGDSTRGMTSAFLIRMLDVLNNQQPPAPTEPKFYVGTANATDTVKGKEYPSFADAKAAATGTNDVVLKENKVVYMKSGQVTNSVTAAKVDIWNNTSFSYIVIGLKSGTPVEFLDADENWVKVKFGGKTGYVKSEQVNLIPTLQIKGQSYYEVKDGLLKHYIYNALTNKYEIPYLYGRSDADMPTGKYYSDNGSLYKNAADGKTYEAYQYFNMMPLYTKSSYTAEELNQYVKNNKADSVLATMGAKFKEIESKYNINAMYLLAHAIHESEWGTSVHATRDKNLFGLGAVDGSGTADVFDTYDDCFAELVNRLTKPTDGYLTANWRYQGEFLGNKDLGMNVFYATDPYWGQKIAGHMHRMDIALGGKERNKYPIAITLTEGATTKVRSNPTVNSGNLLYELTKTGTPVVVLNTIATPTEGTWYEIAPKNLGGANYDKAYVYSHGASYGTNMKLIELAKE
jgi:beta-N-acetylglucosaminidase